jgi:hypothetical protein
MSDKTQDNELLNALKEGGAVAKLLTDQDILELFPNVKLTPKDQPRMWSCHIGYAKDLELGADSPMRNAVQKAFLELTGHEPEFISSGWAGRLSNLVKAFGSSEFKFPEKESFIEELVILYKKISIIYDMMKDVENKQLYADKAEKLESQLGFTVSEEDMVIL